ncbi:conserved hypothetical protein [Theileria orientalis strain Shintoku]|uniref:Uncharacterized protein n=1 Tax=Theileria orientalis strain Shintoku TaxID=869250 RepID=J4C8F1_THEOR|nr:conserved hypothetical protein [Theileria orientalis strain Shintoku]BAM40678.1 conserved hypothetical protein [Theileria orientalis strain Shintoku]|eukprot:XP_009690979.1 conserved hypothetical protein [Theileria orientalis strain Shintoku]
MLAESPRFVDASSNGSSPRGLLSSLNCCNRKNHSHITLPIVDPTFYAHKLAYKNIELKNSQYLATQPLLQSNLGDLTTEEFSELFNTNMLLGFNNRFNPLKKKLDNDKNDFTLENVAPEDLHENNNAFPDSKNEETSSNINLPLESLPTGEANKPVWNLLGKCFNAPNPNSNNWNNSLGNMNSLMDPPEFLDSETLGDGNKPGLFSKCLGPLKPNTLDKFSSIVSQATLVPSDVGCFNTCTKKLNKYVDVEKLSTMASNSTLGLKNLYKSFSQNNLLSSTQSFFDCFKKETGHLPSNFANLNTNSFNSGPNTFRLHAVEIHQYVPFPNLPSSRFVNEGALSNKVNTKYVQDCFFNPNATGMAAPMIPNLLNGVKNVPEVYHLKNKANRLSTQDLSMCVFPTESNDGLPGLVLVE